MWNPLLRELDCLAVLIADTDKSDHSRLPFPNWKLKLFSAFAFSVNIFKHREASQKYQKFWMIGKNLLGYQNGHCEMFPY